MRTLRTRLAALRADARGASVIEFALFAPILGMMLMGVSDLAMGYSAKLRVEQAAYRGLEKVAMGTVQTDYDYLRTEAANSDGPGGIEAGEVTVDMFLECNETRSTGGFNGVCAAGQRTARYVRLTVTDTYTPRFSYGRVFGNAQGVVPLSATAALRIQ